MDSFDELSRMDLGGKKPRWYQVNAVLQCRDAIRSGKKSLIIAAPTGAGKTAVSCMLMKLALEKKNRCVFLAHRRELILQASNHLADANVFHGVVLAGYDNRREPHAPVQVASKQTLTARALRRDRLKLPQADLLIIDEAHGATSSEHMQLIRKFREQNPNLVLLGLTATPARNDDKGLGLLFDEIIQPVTYEQLREEGFIVPARVFALHCPDMKRVKSQEWDNEAAKKVDKPQLVGDIYKNWKKHASDRQTVAFGKTKDHSRHIAQMFIEKGVKAVHIDEGTPVDERAQVLDDLCKGYIQLVSNCSILCEGFDEPSVSCVILACPTRSLVKYRQSSGRTLRPCDGKSDAVILDHAGAVFTHGMFPDDDIEWKLDTATSTSKEYKAKRQRGETKEPTICDKCHCGFYGKVCPNCGSRSVRSGREIAIKHGMLEEVKRNPDKVGRDAPHSVKVKAWRNALGAAAWRRQTAGSAAHIYKNRVGEFPWETPDLPDVPSHGDWKMPVRELFPWLVRTTSRQS